MNDYEIGETKLILTSYSVHAKILEDFPRFFLNFNQI